MSKKSIETAINDYVRSETNGDTFQTGWIICVSLAPGSGEKLPVDSYMTISSDGLPAHTQLGLLKIGEMDLRNLSLLGAMGKVLSFALEEDDEEEDGVGEF